MALEEQDGCDKVQQEAAWVVVFLHDNLVSFFTLRKAMRRYSILLIMTNDAMAYAVLPTLYSFLLKSVRQQLLMTNAPRLASHLGGGAKNLHFKPPLATEHF